MKCQNCGSDFYTPFCHKCGAPTNFVPPVTPVTQIRQQVQQESYSPPPAPQLPSIPMNEIDCMDGGSFEYFVADLLSASGFKRIDVTPLSNDYGVDVIAVKDRNKYAFQCKRYQSNIGVDSVQEVYAGMARYGAQIAVVITNAYFTRQAQELAHSTGVQLWDRDILQRMMAGKKIKPRHLRMASSGKVKNPGWYAAGLAFAPFYFVGSLLWQSTKKSVGRRGRRRY